ncbi:MAG: PKD domain-containing protein [Bacteroidales bacterium]|nr:PKD domain-containing protein [Bacteroidales bacterium]
MKKQNYTLSLMLAGLLIVIGSADLFSQDDNPNLDRIPADFLQHQANQTRNPSTVVTIDGYDNYYLGVDFAEGHISENPLTTGEYFVAFNIDDIHYTNNGHDWSNSNVSWGGYYIRGDVLTAYDSDGTLYYENMYGSSIQGCVVVKSTDNGQSWSSPVVAISGVDKNWMAADQTDGPYSNHVYTVMTKGGGSGNFARSTNQGTSFSTTFSPSTQSLPGMMVCVGAWGTTNGGAVYVVTNSGGAFNSVYTFYQSLNGGSSFSYKSAQSFANYVGNNVNGRNSVSNMRTRPYPFITADNSDGTYRGRLYLVYASNDPVGNGNKPDIFCRYSDDGGATWSSDVTVNDDFPSNTNNQWHPATWCDYETGRLYVQWMDTRDTPSADSALIYGSYSDDGGQTFVQNHAISNVKMKINCTTCGGGGTPRYEGDYNGIVSNPVTSMATWSDFRNGNFATYTGYFPDYALFVSPASAPAINNIASFDAEVPSVKAYDSDVVFSVEVEIPSTGTFTVNFPSGNTLSSFPGTIPFEVISDGNVPVGFYDVILTGAGPNGTPVHIRTASVEIVPAAGPTADFTASTTSICAGEMIDFTDLSTGGPTSWEWTFDGGDPATSTDQNPGGIVYDTPGLYDVTLLVTNGAGSNSLARADYIEVLALPPAPVGTDEEACFGDVVPDLTATGTMVQWYSDPGLTTLVYTGNTFATGQTNSGVYTYYITQTVGGCESPANTIILTIYALPDVGLAPFSAVCIDEPAFALTGGSPAGGIYSGTGVNTDGIFDPAAAGPGMHDITYTFMDANGCSNDTIQPIIVNDLPVVTFDPIPDVCLNDGPQTLSGGMPAGGTYSGSGVASGVFDPLAAGIGNHIITYNYTDANGCTNSADQNVTVNDVPHPDLGPDSAFCAGQSITLDATTAGAVAYEWYPGGETSATITVDTSGYGIGSHMFIAYVNDGNGCTGADTIMVEIEDCTGIGELAGVDNITLYPNPGQGEFKLQIDTKNPMELNIKVYNNRGLTVFEDQGLRINNSELVRMDLSSQPAGIYMVTVYNRQGRWIEKLIILK